MKRMKRVLVCTMLLTMLGCLNAVAQTLVVRFTDGTTTDMELTSDFDASIADGKVTFSSGGTTQEYQCASIVGFSYRETKGDVNRDNAVDVADIATIISIMAGNYNNNNGNAPEGAKGVDLGLPSGTLWANMNVGATSPQEEGFYFAWGETTGYTSNTSDGRSFDWASYKWMSEGQSIWNYVNKYQAADGQTDGCWYQYNWESMDYEFVGDGKTILEAKDDAATVNWGSDWSIPTYEDFTELLNNTTNEWITVGSVTGYKFKSKTNGNSIFLPAAGYRGDTIYENFGIYGDYWSASLDTTNSSDAYYLCFDSRSISANGYYNGGHARRYGRCVRPVLRKK